LIEENLALRKFQLLQMGLEKPPIVFDERGEKKIFFVGVHYQQSFSNWVAPHDYKLALFGCERENSSLVSIAITHMIGARTITR
jgi:hypothetical protein